MPTLSKLTLTNFRNYTSKSFDFSSNIVAIYGNNGIGKSNILEAITLLEKGRGLRGGEFDDMINDDPTKNSFTIYSKIQNFDQIFSIGTSYQRNENKRIFKKIDCHPDWEPSFVWLTPQMDNLFLMPKNQRRKFFDKIVCDLDKSHSARINAYEKSLKERLKLLEEYGSKKHEAWLDIVERKIAELGVAITISRNETITHLNRVIKISDSNFIKAKIELISEIGEWSLEDKAIFVEDRFANKLKENRNLDQKIGRTMFGIHRDDFSAQSLTKKINVKHCSTGEQKSLLIAITFARIHAVISLNIAAPILLLDEIVSHLDQSRRDELFAEINKLDTQFFLTATSLEMYNNLQKICYKKIQFLNPST